MKIDPKVLERLKKRNLAGDGEEMPDETPLPEEDGGEGMPSEAEPVPGEEPAMEEEPLPEEGADEFMEEEPEPVRSGKKDRRLAGTRKPRRGKSSGKGKGKGKSNGGKKSRKESRDRRLSGTR